MSNDNSKEAPIFVFGQQIPDFWWTVRIPLPTDNDYRVALLDVQFAAVDQPELDRMRGIGLAEGEQAPSDAEIARQVMRGWKLVDANGQPVLFEPHRVDELLRAPIVRTAIVSTYLAAMSGVAARKNA